MLRRTCSFAVATVIGCAAANLMSQEDVRPGIQNDAARRGTVAARPAEKSIAWRYRQWNGRWWYWTTQNEWVVWNNGQWVKPASLSNTSPAAVDQHAVRSAAQSPVQEYRAYRFDPAGGSAPGTFQQGTGGYHTEPGYSNLHRQPGFPTLQQGTGGYHTEPGYSQLRRNPGPAIFQQGLGGGCDSNGHYNGDPRDQGYFRYYGFGGDFYSD